MSPIRLPKLDKITSTIEGIRDRFSRKGRARGTHTKHRRLLLDPLEQRQLLSVSAGDMTDIAVTEPLTVQQMAWHDYTGSKTYSYTYVNPADTSESLVVTRSLYATKLGLATTNTSQSTAVDDDGDFVVTYERDDQIGRLGLNANGSIVGITVEFSTSGGAPIVHGTAQYGSIVNPDTGNTVVDTNIYARYFTDEVQRITLPSSLQSYGTFQLRTSDKVVQKLTLSAGYQPFSGQSGVSGSFWLVYNEGDSSGAPSTGEYAKVEGYSSSQSMEANAQAIQNAIDAIVGLSDKHAVVKAINSQEFQIEYDAEATGAQPLLEVNPSTLGGELANVNLNGFCAAALMTTVSQPVTSYQILVSPNDPYATAASIEAAFGGTGGYTYIAPTDFPTPDRVNPTGPTASGPYQQPLSVWTTAPKISVKPVLGTGKDGLVFDVTFVGTSGKQDQPLLAVVDSAGSAIANASVATLKETSDEFRVNPEEPDNQFTTAMPDTYVQTAPAVAMDADGDFVITWQSEVPNSANFGSVTDIYARRFSPIGLKKVVDSATQTLADVTASDVRGYVVPGIRSWIDDVQTIEFRFADPVTGTITGKFKLELDGVETEEINFNSSDLLQVAEDIQDQLVQIGYEGVEVKSLSSSNPFQFEVHFTGRSGGIKQPLITYDTSSALVVQSFTATHKEGTGTLTAAQAAALSTFQVNTFTTNNQSQPAIGMDDLGNFVIAWAGMGQDLSFFNGIYAQRYDRYGGRVGNELSVFTEDTDEHYNPYVALSNSGNFVVCWSHTEDAGGVTGQTNGTANVLAKVYDADGNVIRGEFNAGGGGGASVAFDSNDNWVITYSFLATDPATTIQATDTWAAIYTLEGNPLRTAFRVNSATNNSEAELWPLGQSAAQAMVDADGDLVIAYQGFGPDVSEDVVSYGAFANYLDRWINDDKNADLLPYIQQLWTLTTHSYNQPRYEAYTSYQYQDTFGNWLSYQLRSNGDVDGVLDAILIHATNPRTGETDWATGNPMTAATNEQLGRLRAILEGGLGLLRGEANGVMYSSWDAAPGWNTNPSILYSDNVINAERDGNNAKFVVALTGGLDWESFVLRISRGGTTGYVDVSIDCAETTNNIFDPERTIQAINDTLEDEDVFQALGDAWPETNYGGAVDVRRIYSDEIVSRTGTAWDLTTRGILATDYVYEITFQGAAHDTAMSITTASPTRSVIASNEVQLITVATQSTTTLPVTGTFTVTIPAHNNLQGATTTIDFDSSTTAGLNTARAQIQSFVRGYTGGGTTTPYQNAVVTLVPGDTINGPWAFQVVFNSGTNVPQLGLSVLRVNPETGAQERTLNGTVTGSTENDGGDTDGPAPVILRQTAGSAGTSQTWASAGMETDGDFVTSWTQYQSGNYSIYYRRFDESTDTAGPLVSDVAATNNTRPATIDQDSTLFVGDDGLKYLVLTFDEDMMTTGSDSVTNVLNYQLLRNGVELRGAVIKAEYGLNKASELASAYGLSATPSNKYEVVLTIDGNGAETGTPALGTGDYTIVALAPVAATAANPNGQSGLRDRAGNPLGYSGFNPNGQNFNRHFFVRAGNAGDDPGTDPDDPGPGGSGDYDGINGHTDPETPGAVAVDGDGDHIRVWTAYDATSGFERVYVAIYDADGDLAVVQEPGDPAHVVLPFTVTSGTVANDQRYASVACDKDGDFVVTWTQYDQDGNADIYARRFNSDGTNAGDAFRVNTYTVNQQKWSNVAMDVDGDFVVTWSSYGQEDNNQLGSGYGVYARRFDSYGTPMATEFRVNTTTAGNQQFSNVAMAGDGSFAVTWTSDQDGVGQNIFARAFDANGIALATPLTGEVMVNTTAAGNQVYPDISCNLDGTSYVITWSSAGQDGDGWGVYSRLFDQSLLATSAEILVNTTTAGDQQYSSVAMADDGSFVVTWSGRGELQNQVDDMGVYYQRFDAAGVKSGTETRTNNSVVGNQYLSSIGSDAEGNFVIVWTGVGSGTSSTDVYKYVSLNSNPAKDLVGPIVTDVLEADGSRLLDGDIVVPSGTGMTSLTVVFDENLNMTDLTTGQHSVLNPANWSLTRNGTEIIGAIKSVEFVRNSVTRKYEAVLTLDGNGLSNGTTALSAGDYVLTVRDTIWDAADNLDTASGKRLGNSLDGDFNGVPGTLATGTGYPGYKFHFTVTADPKLGGEFLVNENPQYEQQLSDPTGTGNGTEETTRSVAVDHDGDFVVVWTSYGQDDASDPDGTGIYYRVYDRNGTALTGELRANTTIVGHQRDASVAIDADGDFVIVWEAENADSDGSAAIMARRFDSKGNALGGEFRVNSNTTNDQLNPAVAMDNDGNFVVVWATTGQDFSYFNDIHAQRYNSSGDRIGSEFRVNPNNTTGAAGYETNPTVAIADTGHFIVAWDQAAAQQNGVVTDTTGYFQVFSFADATTVGVLTQVPPTPYNSVVTRMERNLQLAVSDNPNQTEFVVVWEALGEDDLVAGVNYGIYYAQYTVSLTGVLTAGSFGLANMVQFTGDQVNPTVSMDADGDFVIAWNGNGATPDALNPGNTTLLADQDTEGVFIRRFSARGGATQPVTVQSRVNRTEAGVQQFASVGMTRDGSYVVVWSGRGVGDQQGIYARRYAETTDTAGPMVTDFFFGDGNRIEANAQVTESLSQIAITFDEAMLDTGVSGANSVTNPANYHLMKNGVELVGGIASVTYRLNPATNKYEALLTFDGDGVTPGVVPLGEGQYEIVVDNKLRDKAGNALSFSVNTLNGAKYSRSFNITEVGSQGSEQLVNDTVVGSQLTQPESPQPVASDADGNYVAVWTDPGFVRARIYRTTITEGASNSRQSVVNPEPFEITVATGASVTNASVAMDADGDFVVTWSQDDGGTSSWNVYAQRFNAKGVALGNWFRVNTYTDNVQRYSTVAMDQDGDFLIAWQSFGQDGSGYGIYAQRYSPAGTPLGGTNEVQVLEFENSPVGTFTLSWDFDKDPATPAMVTDPITFAGNLAQAAEAVAKALNDKANATLGVDPAGNRFEVLVMSQTELAIRFINTAGGQDQKPLTLGSVTLSSGSQSKVTLRTSVDGSTGEFLVNDTTANSQVYACAAMSAQGDIVVSWTGFGQDGDAVSESNVYAKTLPRNSAIRGNTVAPTYESLTKGTNPLSSAIEPKIIASDSPDERLVPAGTGVCLVAADAGWYGSGTLLSTGRHVLTAAHVVTDDLFGNPLPGNSIHVTFNTANGPVTIQGRRVYSLPSWEGTVTFDFTTGQDIAILELESAAPASIPRYDIYRDDDEIGKIASLYGYGRTGTGDFGAIYADQQLRWGQNRLDCTGDLMGYSADVLMYDFDSGLEYDDTLGLWLGIHDLGMGTYEVNTAPGDSGGPSFIDGKIAGVHSFGTIISSFGATSADTRVSVHAEWIDQILASTSEFLVSSVTTLAGGATSTTTVGNQMWSSVAMDADGDFVITWTSEGQDGVGNGYGANVNGNNGVYARRFGGPTGGALGAEFQVNSYAADDQQHSRVDMDADGDFIVVWESLQDNPQSTVDNSWGIYAQRYVRSEELGQEAWYGVNGELGGEFRINDTLAGDQRFPGVAMDDTGDYVVVWSGQGTDASRLVSDSQGVFLRSFTKTADDAGPTVTNIANMLTASTGQTILDGVVLDENVTMLLLNMSEALSIEGGMNGRTSVLNPQNWQLTKDGEVLGGVIRSIELGGNRDDGFNTLSGKYEIKVTFDADPTTTAIDSLGQGEYVLTMKDRVEDLFGNRLDGNLDGTPGGNFNLNFSVYLGLPSSGGPGGPGTPSSEAEDDRINLNNQNDQNNPVVASNASGDYVVVWTTYAATQGGTTLQANTIAQRFDRYGQKRGGEFLVNTYLAGDQSQPDVAMDDFGNFVVVWAGMGEEDTAGIYARRFDAYGNALDDEEFCVNVYRPGTQSEPQVAMDADGDFVISWTSFGQDGDTDGVYARRYNFNGLPQGNSGEFLVNTTTTRRQKTSDVAMDDNGNFTIVWMSEAQDGSFDGVYGQRFNKDGQKLGAEFRVTQTTNDNQNDPQVAMDADGDFVVTWASKLQDGSGYGVYARRYSKAGVALSNEFRVNETTANYQYQPDVSMDDSGKFVVTWTTFDQDNVPTLNNRDNSVYARMYNADGTPQTGEFRVNATEEGNQLNSAVAMDKDGDFTVVWVGPDSSGTGIFNRVVAVNVDTYTPSYDSSDYSDVYGYDFVVETTTYASSSLNLTGTSGNDLLEFVAGVNRSSWIVKLNGVVQAVAADVAAIHFDGLGGTDTVRIVGTAASESVELWPDHLAFAGLDYTLDAQHIEVVEIDGKGGNDTALLHDSAGNDTLTVSPTTASFNGAQFAQTLSNFETVKAYAKAGGNDMATLYGSAGDDQFTGSQNYGELRGTNYTLRAEGFDSVTADGRNGGNDVAELCDSAGNDTFVATPTFSSLGRDGVYLIRAKYFDTVTAISTLGGVDVARFEDSKGDDTFTAKPAYGEMAGPGYVTAAKGFDKLYAKATSGNDVANLYDSAGNDRFVATPTEATFQVNGASYEVSRFDVVQAYATAGGYDVAELFDSAGDDTLEAGPTTTKLWNRSFQNVATGFDAVLAYAAAGGTDTAILSDSAGDDLFVGKDQDARLYGASFYLRARMFDRVFANAQVGGNDTAKLLSTPDAQVVATDQSTSPTAGTYGLTSSQSSTQTTSASHIAWLNEFEQVQVKNEATGNGSSSTSALDKIFEAFWEE